MTRAVTEMSDTDKLIVGLCVLRGKITRASFYNSDGGALFHLKEKIDPDAAHILECHGWHFVNDGRGIVFHGGGEW